MQCLNIVRDFHGIHLVVRGRKQPLMLLAAALLQLMGHVYIHV